MNNNAMVALDDVLAPDIETIVSGREVILPLTGSKAVKGSHLIGKFMGFWELPVKEGETKEATSHLARFGVIHTNMKDGDNDIVMGEVVSVFSSGLLDWALTKKAIPGDVLVIRFNGKNSKKVDGQVRVLNDVSVKRLTEFQALALRDKLVVSQ